MSTAPGRLVFKAGEGSAHRPRNKKTGGTRKTNSETEDKLETPAANNSSGEISAFITRGVRQARGATGSEAARRRHAPTDEKGKAACWERSQRNAEKRGGRTPPRSNGTQQTATQRSSVFEPNGTHASKNGARPRSRRARGSAEDKAREFPRAPAHREGRRNGTTDCLATCAGEPFCETRSKRQLLLSTELGPPSRRARANLANTKRAVFANKCHFQVRQKAPGTDNKRGFGCSCALCGAQRGF
ncbi:hypothetical protein ERJ75_001229700 [Trypanosoma vivax]|nr:hypothetical protein ERJ75_001229700 [Trypanosoma vivax]